MPPKLYWQSVQLSSLLAVIPLVGVGPGCDSDGQSRAAAQARSLANAAATAAASASAAAARSAAAAVPPAASSGGEGRLEFERKFSADPPAPAGDLQAEIDAFTTIDACVESRMKVDPLLGDVLEAIGYDTFFIDACELLDAAKSRDTKRCASIDASPVRERCEATVSEIARDPDTCPWAIADHPREGRDPACLAVALRDKRLCASVLETRARVTCEAMAAQDAKACARLGGKAAARCQRSAIRWARALGGGVGAAANGPTPFSPSEKVSYAPTPAASASATTVDLSSDVQRGLVLVESHDGWRLRAGVANDDEDLIGPAPHAGASFSFELLVPAGGGAPIIEGASLRVPGHLPVPWNAARGTMRATLQKLEPIRAGVVQLSLEGDAKDANESNGGWHIQAEVRTFVRDTVRAVDLLRPGSRGPREGGGRVGQY